MGQKWFNYNQLHITFIACTACSNSRSSLSILPDCRFHIYAMQPSPIGASGHLTNINSSMQQTQLQKWMGRGTALSFIDYGAAISHLKFCSALIIISLAVSISFPPCSLPPEQLAIKWSRKTLTVYKNLAQKSSYIVFCTNIWGTYRIIISFHKTMINKQTNNAYIDKLDF